MSGMFKQLVLQLWHDDSGSVIATEYLALGTLMAVGTVSGLEAMRDATVSEMQEYGNSVRSIRQQYSAPGMNSKVASRGGSQAVDSCSAGACP